MFVGRRGALSSPAAPFERHGIVDRPRLTAKGYSMLMILDAHGWAKLENSGRRT